MQLRSVDPESELTFADFSLFVSLLYVAIPTLRGRAVEFPTRSANASELPCKDEIAEQPACSVFRNLRGCSWLPIGKQGPVIQQVTVLSFRIPNRSLNRVSRKNLHV